MLLAIDFDEDFVDEKGVTVAPELSLQSSSIYSAEFDTPEADGFATDSDASLSEQVFNIPVAQIESIVEPDGVTDDIWRKSVTFVCVHGPSLPISAR